MAVASPILNSLSRDCLSRQSAMTDHDGSDTKTSTTRSFDDEIDIGACPPVPAALFFPPVVAAAATYGIIIFECATIAKLKEGCFFFFSLVSPFTSARPCIPLELITDLTDCAAL